MRVGVPSEIKVHEYRVGLTPGAVREYVAHGHQVVVQSGAGAGIMASDDAYRAAGAEIITQDTPVKVAINEFVDVAKACFPDGKEAKFVNAVLDHMARAAKPEAFIN